MKLNVEESVAMGAYHTTECSSNGMGPVIIPKGRLAINVTRRSNPHRQLKRIINNNN